jgi:hypothetical protein
MIIHYIPRYPNAPKPSAVILETPNGWNVSRGPSFLGACKTIDDARQLALYGGDSGLQFTCGRCGASGDSLTWFTYHKLLECKGGGV